MHKVIENGQVLLSLSAVELRAIAAAVESAAAEDQGSDDHVKSKFGLGRDALTAVVDALRAVVHPSRQVHELATVWEDSGVVMVRVMNTYGDPVEMNLHEVDDFVDKLKQAARADLLQARSGFDGSKQMTANREES